ncbi:MAG TPA: hypothetical protein VD903_21475 [Pseudonocardia sp.]|nr:hypothetical protein [Pseudonocardia sp.]
MLHARRTSVWKSTYEITADGRPIATWTGRAWKAGGRFELDGRPYEVSANAWGNRFEMSAVHGGPVASAERVGRKHWTVDADGRTYRFRRASLLSADQILLDGEREAGWIRKTSVWRSDAEADLPGLSLPAQVFVLVVVLRMWEAAAAAASA